MTLNVENDNIDSGFRVLGGQGTLAIEVHGPTRDHCLARAVEAYTSCVAEVHPSIMGEPHPLQLASDIDDASALRAVLDAIAAIATSGFLAIALHASEDHLMFEVVPFTAVRLNDQLPGALRWHDVVLSERDGGWHGRAVATGRATRP